MGDSVILKTTNIHEVTSYERIFHSSEKDPKHEENINFQKFLPKYYGYILSEIPTEDGKNLNYKIRIENLLNSRPNANVLDLRMGSSSITVNTPPHLYERFKLKDNKTTTVTHGFRVTAYIIKDSHGSIVEKVVKPHGKVLAEHIPAIMRKVLSGNNYGEINRNALDFFRRRLGEILEHFQKYNSRLITGSSVLFIVDNIENSFEMKIIDLSHF
jgi:hypothetical protein